jgi:signal transduction histidine kinase
LIRHLLNDIHLKIGAAYTCVVSSTSAPNHIERIASYADDHGTMAEVEDKTLSLLQDIFRRLTPASKAVILNADLLGKLPFQSALVLPLAMPDTALGLIGIFADQPDAFTPASVEAIEAEVALVRVVLENTFMYNVMAQNLIVTQSIQLAAKEIADNPSPQHVVNILRDYFFDAHVTSCALLLYGPLREDRPNGPFEYMEVRGTWSKRRGSGVGVGVRFYIDDLPDLLEQLDEEEVLVFPRAKDLSVRLDPLLRIFLQAERVRSMTLLALHANHRKLGVIFVGSDKRHQFSTQELHNYRTVSEFMAINVMTQMLQLQHDRVQQGRAALLDAVTDGVIMVLPSAGGARVLTVNKRFLELFELPSSLNVQDTPLADLLDKLPFPESQRADLRKIWLAIPVRDPSTQNGEFHRVNDEGQPLDIEWYSVPVYQENQVLGRVYVFHDITADRTAQRLRSAFLSRVSHELRTPLTAIRGFAEFILEANGDQLPPLAKEYTEIILNSARHLNRVFTDMIDMTRADAGEMKLHRTDAQLRTIIRDVVARLELMLKERNQRVELALADGLPQVSVDVDRMMQVLTNLLTNAIKYSPEGGIITISSEYVERVNELPSGAPDDVILPAVMVTVSDTGKGLDKDQAQRVFMPFYRTDDAKKAKIEGVGLGLAVTQSIVEMHRGRVWAIPSRKGSEGGRFVFTIPTKEKRTED